MFTRGVIAFWFTILLVMGLALVPDDLPDSAVTVHASAETSGEVRIAAANVYEGSLVRHPADLRDGTDRKAFARRLLGRSGRGA